MRLFSAGILSLFLSVSGAILAQEDVTGQALANSEVFKTAPVIVDGRVLFELRGVSSYPAKKRASETRKRILDIARNKGIDPESIKAVKKDDHFEIVAGSDQMLVRVFDADAELEAIPLELLARTIQIQIHDSVVEYRKDRSPTALRVSALYFVLLTALFALLVWALKKFKIWAGRVIKAKIASDIKHIEQKSRRLIHRGQVFDIIQFLLQWLHVIVLIALVSLCNQLLGLLPDFAGEPITLQRLLGIIVAPLVWLIGIPWSEALTAGGLLGTKTVLNEFVAYLNLAALPAGALGERSRLIMVYALCGFANFGSLGIMIGGLGAMAPERRDEIVSLGMKSILAGVMATCMTGAVVGIIY